MENRRGNFSLMTSGNPLCTRSREGGLGFRVVLPLRVLLGYPGYE